MHLYIFSRDYIQNNDVFLYNLNTEHKINFSEQELIINFMYK